MGSLPQEGLGVSGLRGVGDRMSRCRECGAEFYGEYIHPNPEIEGWMFDYELEWLYQRAKEMRSIVELGSWKGRSTHALLSGCPGPVYAVDMWQGSASEKHLLDMAQAEDVFATFTRNMRGFDNLIVRKADSASAACGPFLRGVDCVFVDADHCYDAVKADLKAWFNVPRKLLCGHDRHESGVPFVLKELVEADVPLQLCPGTIWAIPEPQKYWPVVKKLWGVG